MRNDRTIMELDDDMGILSQPTFMTYMTAHASKDLGKPHKTSLMIITFITEFQTTGLLTIKQML